MKYYFNGINFNFLLRLKFFNVTVLVLFKGDAIILRNLQVFGKAS